MRKGIVAAWAVWRKFHPHLSMGPGPGFQEAIAAYLAAESDERDPAARIQELLASQTELHKRAQTWRQRAEAAEAALLKVRDAIERADPDVLVCTLWMPDDVSMGETVCDFITSALAPAAQGETEALGIACCTCGAKSPDLKWHDPACTYRLAEEAAAPAPSAGETQDERAMSIIKRAAEVMRRLSQKTVEQFWQELLEKDDRTSPEEYPDMALITFDEFSGYMAQAIYAAAPAPSAGETRAAIIAECVKAIRTCADSYGDGSTLYLSALKDAEQEVRALAAAPAPAPSAGEMRKLLAIIEIERPEAIAHAEKRLLELPNEKYDPRDSLPEEHDAAPAPSAGETGQ